MSTEMQLWLDKRDEPEKPVVIFEQDNVRITVHRNYAQFEMFDEDRLGVKRWRDVEVDWGLRRMVTILAKQQIELVRRQRVEEFNKSQRPAAASNIDEPARQD